MDGREGGWEERDGRQVCLVPRCQWDVKELGKGLKMETGELVGGFICAPG